MDPDFFNNLQNFGFAAMAAGGQPGATTLGALGAGGLGMNQAANQRIQMQNVQQEGIGRQLGNAVSLRQLNMGNSMLGLAPVTMKGVPDLMPQQTPSGLNAGQPWSNSAGGNNVVPQTRSAPMSPENAGKMAELYPDSQQSTIQSPPQSGGMYGYSPGALEVARGLRPPADLQEATQAASLLSFTGMNPNRQKELEGLVAKNQEPQNLREGNQLYYPLGGKTVAASKNVNGLNDQNQPVVTSYTPSLIINGDKDTGGRNAGGGVSSGGGSGGIRTGFSPQEEATQKNYFGKETDSYNGAQKSMQNLQLMQHSIDTLNKDPNFLSTGTWGEKKLAFAKSLQGTGFDLFDPDRISAGESLLKTTGRLGFDMSKQLGAREPGVITQQAIKLNPGIENTPQGVQLLKDSVQEEAQRVIDEHNFKSSYYAQSGYNQQKAESSFDSKYPPALYAKRAASQTDPIKVNTPAAAKQLLAGTKIKTPDGRIKIIPENIGVAPPTFQDINQPHSVAQPVEIGGEE